MTLVYQGNARLAGKTPKVGGTQQALENSPIARLKVLCARKEQITLLFRKKEAFGHSAICKG